MAAKFVPSKCPTCGAMLPVPVGAQQVTCRYCQAVIHVEHKKPPPQVIPFGVPGGMPSRTLYLDPKIAEQMAKAGKGIGCFVTLMTLLPIVIVAAVAAGPWLYRTIRGSVRPFPIACALNEELTLSGNYEGQGPLITSAGHNCKVHIKDAKLKGSKLVETESVNLEITLENVTLETTEVAIHAGSNLKLHVTNSTLVSAAHLIETESNVELTAEGSTLQSKGGAVVKTKSNLKARLDGTKIVGKKAGIDGDSNFDLTMKKGSEVSASDGPAIKTGSSFDLEADGGKIDGGIVATSGAKIDAVGLSITAKEKALATTSGLKLSLTDGSITSSSDIAIETDSGPELTLANSKVQGTVGIKTSSGAKLKATKKTRIVGTQGFAMASTSNAVVAMTDAMLEGERALKGTVNVHLELGQGASLAGKKGGIELESNAEIQATGAVIDGGSGPGLVTGSNARIAFKSGMLKGNPALRTERRPMLLELDGTQVQGAQVVPAR